MLGGVLLPVQRFTELAQDRQAHHLAVQVWGLQDRYRGEGALHDRSILLLGLVPATEVGAHLVRKDAIGHHQVGGVVVQVEVGEGPLRLVDDDLLQGEHHPDRRLFWVRQQRAHVLELGEQLLAGVEDVVTRHGQAHHALDQRTGEAREPAADGLDLLHPPLHCLWKRQEAQRLAGRRCVHHDHVVQPRVVVVGDPEQAADLVHAGQHGHLLGQHVVQAAPAKHAGRVFLDPPPVARYVVEDVRLLPPQVRTDLDRLGSELHAEHVTQAVRDVGRQHHGPLPRGGTGERGGGRDARLPHAALAGVQEDAAHRSRVWRNSGTSAP